jgi:hypothetical protein
MTSLNIETLCQEAARFSAAESNHAEKSLYGVTDGKAVGTYLEHKLTFRAFFVPLPTLGFIENKGLLTGAKSAPVGSSRKRC